MLTTFPWRLSFDPKRIQQTVVTIGIHALPETVVSVHGQLAVSNKPAHGLLFQHQIFAIVQEIKDFPPADKKAAGDLPPVACGFSPNSWRCSRRQFRFHPGRPGGRTPVTVINLPWPS